MPLIACERTGMVGGYTLVRPVVVGVRESVWSAVDPSGSPCTVEICERFDGSAESGAALDAFVERVALQRRVAVTGEPASGLGRGHAVGVRHFEATPFGAFYARDEYGMSGRALVTGKVRLRGDALHEVLAGVVSALGRYRAVAGRAHGALSPESVLIDGESAGRLRIGLRAPATNGELDAAGVDPDAEEMRRLGLLIFELVLHRPFRVMGGYPVRDGSEWQALGGQGGFWLTLVNELLDPSGCRLTLDEVAQRIAGLPFRVDRPGAGVWLSRAGIAAVVLGAVGAGAYFLFAQREDTVRATFEQAHFERWIGVTPVVASLRDAVSERDDVPQAIRDAVGRLSLTESERARLNLDDPFDIPGSFRAAELFKSFERTFDNPLADLVEGVGAFVATEIEAQAQAGEKTEDQQRLERLAGRFEGALERFDGSDDEPGFLGSLTPGEWPALGLVQGLGDAEGLEWLDDSANELFRAATERIESAVRNFSSSVPGVDLSVPTADDPLAGGRLSSVDAFIDASIEIERAANEVGAWRDEVYPSIESAGGSIAASAAWPSLPEDVVRRLEGERDPLLASLGAVPRRVGVVAPGEGVADLDGRLRSAAAALERVSGWLESSWSSEGVDLLELERWVGSVRERIEAEPMGDDAASLALWIDARIELADSWLVAAENSSVIAPADWVVTGFGLATVAAREKWDEAIEAEPERTRDAEEEIAGGRDVLEPRLDEIERRFAALRAMPRWSSLEEEARAERVALREAFDSVEADIEAVYDRVLKPPRTLIAEWRESIGDESGGTGALASVRARLAEEQIDAWETWAGDREEAQLLRAGETDRLRVARRGIDESFAEARTRVDGLLAEGRAFGGFEPDAVRDLIATTAAEVFAEALGSIEAWGDERLYEVGGDIPRRLDDTESLLSRRLDALDAALGLLRSSAVGIERGLVLGEVEGQVNVAVRGDLIAALGTIGEDPFGGLLGVPAIADAASAARGLIGLENENDPGRLLLAFVAEAEADARAGIAVAALERLGDLGEEDDAWPRDAGSLGSDRAMLVDGLVAIRDRLSESDWERVSPRLRTIVSAWWLRGVAKASDRGSFANAVSGAASWFEGVGEDWRGALGARLLSGRSRFNAEVVGIRTRIENAAAEAIDEASRSARDQIPAIDRRLLDRVTTELDSVESLAAQTLGDDERAGVRSWVADFRAALNDARQGRRGWAAEDFGPVGAGLDGWRAELDEDAEPPTVRYIKDGGPSVRFRLIGDLLSGGQVFLSEDEVSVAVCAEIMRYRAGRIGPAIDEWFEVFDDNPRNMKFRGDLFEGPAARDPFVRGRNETRHRVQAAPRWLVGSEYGPAIEKASYPAYPDGLVEPGTDDTISASQGGPPDDFCPVNYIPSRLAREAAEAFGCRLPTVEEFNAALSRVPPVDSGRWNLRDASFARQYAHYEAALAFGVTHYQPGKWSYDGRESIRADIWRVTGNLDDRLWFYRAAGSGTGDDAFGDGVLFRHIIGNVAEYVLKSEESEEVWVMGASALSDPAVQPSEERPDTGPTRGTNGFVDVGFRLAIDADDFGSLGKMVMKQLTATERASFVVAP